MKTTILTCSFALLALASCESDTNKTEATTTTSTSDTTMRSSGAATASQSGTSVEGMKAGMDKMMADMNALSMTGDADHDYASIMRVHHQGAVAMMQTYLRDASDPTLRSMAEMGISKQQKEIEELSAFLSSHQPASKNSSYGKDAVKMISDMMMMENMPTDPNKAFAAMMAPHHESAVHISQMYMNEGKDEKMKAMAKKIAAEQQKETDDLKKWMETHP